MTEKELLMLGERTLEHFSIIEKFRHYSQQCSDPEMKQLIDNHLNRMEQHGQNLMNLVQGGMHQYQQPQQQYGGVNQYGVTMQPGQYQQQY